mgnify:CR=1 FL=1
MERQLKYFFDFLENDKKLSDNTLQSYKRDLKQFKRYIEACEINYNHVKEEDIKDYIKELQEEGKKASSISRCIASIRSFYQFVLKRKKIKVDPTANIQSPKIEKRVPSVLTSKEVELLLDQPKDVDLKGTRDKAMLEFAYATGMRVTEIISLNIDDVNLEEGYVTCKTGNKQRTIPLGTMSLNALKEYVDDARDVLIKNECEIVESEEYILNKYEDDNSIYLKAIDINNKINTLLKKLEKINKEYKLLKNNNLIEEPLLLDDSLLIDDIINYRKTLQKEEINKIPKKIKLLEEYKYLYKNLDDLVEKTEKMKEISNKRVQELSARDKKYKDAKNKIVNLEEVENCCNLIIEKNNNYLEELSKKVDKISERKYVESKLKGMNGFLTSSLRYIWLLSLTPLRGILPGIGARTVATRKLLHNMLKNMHYEKQEKIIYSLGNYESEINNKIYDIDSLNYNIDLALEDVQKLKKEFKDYFLSYSFKEYDKAYKKIELIEKNIIDNKNKVYLIKEKLIKSKELNRNTLTKVKKLNDKN